MEMNPFGVACTSIKYETQIQESWGKIDKTEVKRAGSKNISNVS
jgi:hypothetical protein